MQRWPRTPIPLAAIVLALSLSSVLCLFGVAGALASPRPATGAAPPPASSRPSEVRLPQSVHGPGVQVTMAPAGLSFEYPALAQDLGAGPCPPPALAAELVALGSPPLSIAGDSQDMTAPSGALTGAPSSWETATLYSLPAGFWSQLHCLLSASGDPLTVGLNAKSGQLAWAQQMVAGAQSAATAGLSFSLGNEPDLYYLPNYSSLAKPQADEEAAAVNLYLQVASYLQPALAGAPLIGPELAVPSRWRAQLPRVIAELHEQTVGVHMYPLSACTAPQAATTRALLSAGAADEPRSLAWVVADADAAQVPAIVSEANSVSCGGKAGVSDSPASAVWAVRFVLSALETGFHEVRFHFAGDSYDPFVVRGAEVISRPLDGAMVALNQWLPVGSTLQPLARLRGLIGAAVIGPASAAQLILENERAHAQEIVLRTGATVRVEALSVVRAGVQSKLLSPRRGRVKLLVAANSVLAVLPAPPSA